MSFIYRSASHVIPAEACGSHRAVPRGDDMAPSACLNRTPGRHGSNGLFLSFKKFYALPIALFTTFAESLYTL